MILDAHEIVTAAQAPELADARLGESPQQHHEADGDGGQQSVEDAEPEHGEDRGDGDDAVPMPLEVGPKGGGLQRVAHRVDDDRRQHRLRGQADAGRTSATSTRSTASAIPPARRLAAPAASFADVPE